MVEDQGLLLLHLSLCLRLLLVAVGMDLGVVQSEGEVMTQAWSSLPPLLHPPQLLCAQIITTSG